jgi:alkanesulfonate monooxygenase SsuD/methylene tetrahydromethanopterin reductase-like flavin-dependent oxidoreductase (luciferase family)
MKFSFYCSAIHGDPRHFREETGWPSAPAGYDATLGQRSTDFALEQAAEAERLGFDMVSVSEHHYWPGSPSPNPAVLASAIIQRTQQVRIGLMGPLVSIANPIRVAEEAAMLDQLSHGRMELLFLRGTPNEFISYYVNPAESRERTQEAIDLILAALTQPQPFGWQGRYYQYPTISVWPGTTQKPLPPVWSSGNSPDSIRFAARLGHKIGIAFVPPHLAGTLAEGYRQACAELGRPAGPADILFRAHAVIAPTERQARELEERYYGEGGLGLEAVLRGRGEAVASLLPSAGSSSGGGGRPAGAPALGKLAFAGTPEQVTEQITAFHRETGVGYLDLGFSGGGLTEAERAQSLTLFATQVMPRVRHLGATSAAAAEELTHAR